MDSDHAMKRIFIYGDSNVWGDSFVGSRVRHSDRWVNRLKRENCEAKRISSPTGCQVA